MNGAKKTIAARLVRICDTMACRMLLLFIFLLLFSWPYLSSVDHVSTEALFLYFFVVWAILISILMLISRAKEAVNKTNND